MNRLAGKTGIVTGGAVGIGRACVIRTAEEGAKVAIFDVLEEEGRALAKKIAGKGARPPSGKVDVADEDTLKFATRSGGPLRRTARHGEQCRHLRLPKAN